MKADMLTTGRDSRPMQIDLPGPMVLQPIETGSREAIERLQRTRLMRMIALAYQRAPLIRAKWDEAGIKPADIHSLDDFTRLAPFTSKDDIRAYRDAHHNAYGGMLCEPESVLTGVGFTSGTTGDPTPVSRFTEAVYVRDLWYIGARPGDYYANILFTFRSGHGKRHLNKFGVIPILFTHSPHEIERIVAASLRFRPTTASIVSSPLLNAFDDYFRATNVDPRNVFQSYHGAIFGGEPISPHFRTLSSEWGLELFESTTIGDVSVATECRAHDGMHCYEDEVFLECLAPDSDAPVADGEIGELVVTALTESILPVVRYRTDDLVRLNREPCICGRTHARVRVLGRKSDLTVVAGQSILPSHIFPLMPGLPGASHGLFQIISSGAARGVLLLRIGHDEDLPETARPVLIDAARSRVEAALGVPTEIEIVPAADLLKLGPPHKIPRVSKQ